MTADQLLSHQLSSQLPLHQLEGNSDILTPEAENKINEVRQIPETRNEFTQVEDEQSTNW